MTLHGIDLIAIAAMIVGGFAACYALLMRKLLVMLGDRQMKVADQIGKLDDAIRVVETRLAEHQLQALVLEQSRNVLIAKKQSKAEEHSVPEEGPGESPEIVPEIQAAIAAAAAVAIGPNAVVSSVKAVPSPWTQQGRVLVQGGHNLRVQR